ncbi:MAG: helix-turn-helix domain-containing protein [Planctomycetota bacterium]
MKRHALIPGEVIESDAWGKLSGVGVRVYTGLAYYANTKRVCWPSIKTLSQKAHASERSCRRVLRKLEFLGLIKVLSAGGGHGQSARYQLIYPDQTVRVDESKPGQNSQGFEQDTGTNLTENPDGTDPQTLTNSSGKQSMEQPKKQAPATYPQEPATPVGQSSDEIAVQNALISVGIGEPTRSKLLQLNGITPMIVCEAAAYCHEHSKARGILVMEIQARVEQANAKKARLQQNAELKVQANEIAVKDIPLTGEERQKAIREVQKNIKRPASRGKAAR